MSGFIEISAGTLNVAAPLVFAALAGVISERAGIIHIALEGVMLVSAFVAVAATHLTGSPWTGLAFAVLAGIAVSLLHGFISIHVRANQIISGVAINILAVGLTQFLCSLIFNSSSNSSVVPSLPRWGAGRFTFTPLVWLALAAAPLVHLFLYRTVAGLRLRAVGEHPEAADTLGVRPVRVRYAAVALSGAVASLGGVALAADVSQFVQNMTAGRGYIALAAMIFGKWTPLGALGACLLFALADKSQIALQGVIPPLLAQSIPYLLTILVLAGFVGRARAPGSLGKAYAKTD